MGSAHILPALPSSGLTDPPLPGAPVPSRRPSRPSSCSSQPLGVLPYPVLPEKMQDAQLDLQF